MRSPQTSTSPPPPASRNFAVSSSFNEGIFEQPRPHQGRFENQNCGRGLISTVDGFRLVCLNGAELESKKETERKEERKVTSNLRETRRCEVGYSSLLPFDSTSKGEEGREKRFCLNEGRREGMDEG